MRLLLLLLALILASPRLVAQAVSGPSSATTNAVPSFQDNKHLKNNPLVTIVGGHLYINGAPVLTNAAGAFTFSVNGTTNAAPNLTNTTTLLVSLSSNDVTFWPTNLSDAQIATAAGIAQSKISGLVSDLAAKQTGSVNLTNWSALSTNDMPTLASVAAKQTGSVNLTNWSALSTNALSSLQTGSQNLTNWSAVGTNAFVGTNGTGFPALTGDITTVQGAVATTLKNTGTAGTYQSVTTDAQGRVTAGTTLTAPPATIFSGSLITVTLNGTGRSASINPTTSFSWSSGTEKAVATPIVRAGTFSNLTFRFLVDSSGGAMGSGTNCTLILYTNAVASPFVLTLVTDGTATTTNSGTASLTIPANTFCSWRVTNQVGTVASDVNWTCEFY